MADGPQLQHAMVLCICPCGQTLSIAAGTQRFSCPACGQLLSIPPAPSLSSDDALRTYLIRTVVTREVRSWLAGKVDFRASDSSVIAGLFRKICDFPLFRDKDDGIDAALLDLFAFIPRMDRKLVKSTGRGMEKKITRLIYAPMVASSVSVTAAKVATSFQTRGGANARFKAALVSCLREAEEPGQVLGMVEALESAHSSAELPEALRCCVEAHVPSAVANIEHSLAKDSAGESPSKMRRLYHLVPRRAIVRLLKMHVGGGGAASAACGLLLNKPFACSPPSHSCEAIEAFGSYSVVQRMVATLVGLSNTEKRADDEVGRPLPAAVRVRLATYATAFAAEDGHKDDSSKRLSKPEMLALLARTDLCHNLKASPLPPVPLKQLKEMSASDILIAAANEYLVLRRLLAEKQFAVELAGSRELEALIRSVVPVIQKRLVMAFTVKSSGNIKMVEGLFESWKRILNADKQFVDGKIDAEERRYVFSDCVKRFHAHFLNVTHNVLRSDVTRLFDDVIVWLVGTWRDSNLRIDIDTLIEDAHLSADERMLLLSDEVETLRTYFEADVQRAIGQTAPELPVLYVAEKLVEPIKKMICERAFPKTVTAIERNKLGIPRRLRHRARSMAPDPIKDHTSPITNIEVMYDYEPCERLAERGFVPVTDGLDVNRGSTGPDVTLWVRRSHPLDATCEERVLSPIIDLAAIPDDTAGGAVSRILKSKGFIRINKSLTKGSGKSMHLWYVRRCFERRDSSRIAPGESFKGSPPTTSSLKCERPKAPFVAAELLADSGDAASVETARMLKANGFLKIDRALNVGRWGWAPKVFLWVKRGKVIRERETE